MKNLKKNQYSLRKSLTKDRPIIASPKPNKSNKIMVQTARDEKLNTCVKRTRGRPRTKEPRNSPPSKRHKPTNIGSTNGIKSPKREGSLSPNHQDPPQLEPMPAVEEDEDLDIPLGYTVLNSIDEHLLPGKCIVICPLSTCRKKYANPIELVSHLRNYHEKEKLSSLKIYTCPTCLKTRFSSHTTSSDLTLLSEHAERYHGQTLHQNDFVFFCTLVMDIFTDDKATQKREEKGTTEELVGPIQSQNSDALYHPILPFVPNSTSFSNNRSESNATKVARVTTESLCLRTPSQTGHFIQISPVNQSLPTNNVPTAVSATATPSPYFAALAAVTGQFPSGAFLLSSPSTTNPAVVTTKTSAEQPILIAPSSGICTTPSKSFPVLITSSSAVGDTNHTTSSSNNLQPPQSPSAAAAIATLKQLIQSASNTVKPQQQHKQPPSQTTASSVSFTGSSCLPSLSSRSQVVSPITPGLVSKGAMKPEPTTATPIGYPFVQGGAALVASPGAELEATTDLSSYASASADLLTLARLSVNQATTDALNSSVNNNLNTTVATSTSNQQSTGSKIVQESIAPVLAPQPTGSTTLLRNRRLLPRKTTPFALAATQANQSSVTGTSIPIRKRVALPPLAVKPPKEVPPTTSTPLEGATESSAVTATTCVAEEAPVITAALINPSSSSSAVTATTTTLIPSSTLNNMLAKSKLLATTSTTSTPTAFVNVSTAVAVRPVISQAPAAVMVPSTSNNNMPLSTAQPPSQHLFQRIMPAIRPAPLQKILPRPKVSASVTAVAQSGPVASAQTITVTPNSKEMRHQPLFFSVPPTSLIAQTPATMVTPSLGGAVVTTPNPTVMIAAPNAAPVKLNVANGTAGLVPSASVFTASTTTPTPANVPASSTQLQHQTPANTSVSSDEGHLVICTSP